MPPRDALDLVVLGALWGAAFLFMRVAAPAFGPVTLIAVRVTIAAVLLLPLLVREGGLAQARSAAGRLALVGALNTASPFTLFAYAALTLPAGLSSVLNATVPLFGALVGVVWLGERPRPLQLVGLGLGFAGVLVLAWPRLSSASDWRAVAAALTATLLYAISAHLTRQTLTGVRPLVIAGGSMTGAAAMLLPLTVVWHPAASPASGAWGAALMLGVASTAVAYVMYFRLLARAGPTVAMTVTYLIPVFGVSWGAVFLGERLASTALAGGALVLTGVALATLRPRPPA